MGVLEEGAKAVSGTVEAMRSQPLAIANIVLNICFLGFLIYYVSIIAERAKSVVAQLFAAQDKMAGQLFAAQDKLQEQWTVIIKDQNDLTQKAMHCILPEDALKLIQQQPRPYDAPRAPTERPIAPERQQLHLPSINPHAEKSMLFLPPAPPLTQPFQEVDPPQPQEK